MKITICNQVTIANPEYPALAVFLNLLPTFQEFFETIFGWHKKGKSVYKGNRKCYYIVYCQAHYYQSERKRKRKETLSFQTLKYAVNATGPASK